MSRARDNLRSTRSREDIDHDALARTEVSELRLELLHGQDVERFLKVQRRMAKWALNPRTPEKTAVQAGGAYLRSVIALVQAPPVVNVQQGIQINPGDLLDRVPAAPPAPTTGCGEAPADASSGPETPTPVLQEGTGPGVGDLRLHPPEVVVTLDPEPEQGTAAWREWSERNPPAPTPSLVGRCEACGMRLDEEPHDCPVAGL